MSPFFRPDKNWTQKFLQKSDKTSNFVFLRFDYKLNMQPYKKFWFFDMNFEFKGYNSEITVRHIELKTRQINFEK